MQFWPTRARIGKWDAKNAAVKKERGECPYGCGKSWARGGISSTSVRSTFLAHQSRNATISPPTVLRRWRSSMRRKADAVPNCSFLDVYMTLASRGGSDPWKKAFSAKKPGVCHFLYDRVGLKRRMDLIQSAWERPMPQLSNTLFRTFLNHFWLLQAVLKSQDQSKNVEISTRILAPSTLLLDKTAKNEFLLR